MTQPNATNISKLNTYAVVEPASKQVSKLNAYAVVVLVPINGSLSSTIGNIETNAAGHTVIHGIFENTLDPVGLLTTAEVGLHYHGVLEQTLNSMTLSSFGSAGRRGGVATLLIGA